MELYANKIKLIINLQIFNNIAYKVSFLNNLEYIKNK